MNKKLNTKVRSFLMLFVIGFGMISSSSALSATTNTDIDWNRNLTSGRNIAYRITPGVEYTISIPNAVNKLMYPPSGVGTNRLVLNKTNDYNTSKMDFYQERKSNGINASASVFRKNSWNQYYQMPIREKESYDWVYGEIKINDYYMANYSNAVREAIIVHEMLHVYGLKDISNPNSIMYFRTPNVTTVTSDANNAINRKY